MRTSRIGLVLACVLALGAAPALAQSLSTNITGQITGTYRGSNDLGSPRFDLSTVLQAPIVLGSGFGSNQADRLFSDQRTLAASATETLDLTSALTDPFGATLNFARVKAILVRASTANTNSVVIGDAAANPFVGPLGGTTPTVSVPPGGMVLLVAPAGGWAITNGSNDNLKIANSSSGTPVTFDLIIVGASQ